MKINQIYNLLNAAQEQAWGQRVVEVIDTATMIALGNHVIDSSKTDSKDVFVGGLTDRIGKTLLRSRELAGDDLGISRDQMSFGAILQKIRIKPKLVDYNTEYDLKDEPFDPFKVHPIDVIEQLYSKHTTYECTITILRSQLFSAFTDEASMAAFLALIYKQLEDTIYRAKQVYDRLALANFAIEKFKLQVSQPNKTHTFNLIQGYKNETGITITTEEIWTDKEFLRYVSTKLKEFKKAMNSETDVFNGYEGKDEEDILVSSTSDEYMNLYLLDIVDSRMSSYLYSDTFHNEFVKLNKFKAVQFWQGVKGATGKAFDPVEISKISLKPASGGEGITKSGILAIMIDRDAVVSSYERENSDAWQIPTKGFNHYRAMTHMYINDLLENGIVFYVEDLVEGE